MNLSDKNISYFIFHTHISFPWCKINIRFTLMAFKAMRPFVLNVSIEGLIGSSEWIPATEVMEFQYGHGPLRFFVNFQASFLQTSLATGTWEYVCCKLLSEHLLSSLVILEDCSKVYVCNYTVLFLIYFYLSDGILCMSCRL